MLRLTFDIETNGLDPDCIHCVVAQDADTGELTKFPPGMVAQGIELLQEADVLVGHNITGFDIPVILKLTGVDLRGSLCVDTLAVSKALFVSTLKQSDFRRLKHGFPKSLVGRHSLESWGWRLGEHKGEFAKTTDWSEYSEEMLEYCAQDVNVNTKLFKLLTEFERVPGKKAMPIEAMYVESRIQGILSEQEKYGIDFDEEGAWKLVADLQTEKTLLTRKLQDLFPSEFISSGTLTPKRANKTKGYAAGCPLTKITLRDFNPSSDQQAAERLIRVGWQPTEFTPTGLPKMSEQALNSVESDHPGIPELVRYKTIEKRLGQIHDGKASWINKVTDGKIHGRVQATGARTGRMSASSPNMQQVPRVGSYLGEECRALFGPQDKGYLVGCDASGLELRVLAHYMQNPEFTKEVVEGDVHTLFQNIMGLHSRSNSKTAVYAKLYGASPKKIGETVANDLREAGLPVTQSETALGKEAERRLITKLKGFEALTKGVAQAHKRGFIRLVNGLYIQSASEHSALNSLCQGTGAVIMKMAQYILSQRIDKLDAHFALTVHDEFQLVCEDKEEAETVGWLAVQSIKDAGKILKLNCPLDAEYKVGRNWSETH